MSSVVINRTRLTEAERTRTTLLLKVKLCVFLNDISQIMFNGHSHTGPSVLQPSYWNGGITHSHTNKQAHVHMDTRMLTHINTHNLSKGKSVSKTAWQSFHCSSLSTAGQRKNTEDREVYTFSSQQVKLIHWFGGYSCLIYVHLFLFEIIKEGMQSCKCKCVRRFLASKSFLWP